GRIAAVDPFGSATGGGGGLAPALPFASASQRGIVQARPLGAEMVRPAGSPPQARRNRSASSTTGSVQGTYGITKRVAPASTNGWSRSLTSSMLVAAIIGTWSMYSSLIAAWAALKPPSL